MTETLDALVHAAVSPTEPRSTAMIAAIAGADVGQVGFALRRLRQHGQVRVWSPEQPSYGWVRVPQDKEGER